jgi:S-adenosylmethionine:tRNA ribosyltransferase-isomerase
MGSERMLVIQDGRFDDARASELPRFLRAGDLLVVNDAATVPASLRDEAQGVEVRLAGRNDDGSFAAILFGRGDWRTRTEDRPTPPPVEKLRLGGIDCDVAPVRGRLVTLRFRAGEDELWPALYRAGAPVQYAHLDAPLELWDAQNRYASRPWAMESPSAGRPLTFGLVAALRARGVAIATLTHACGLSSTGDAELDAALPFPERYDLPAATIDAVARATRVIAAGTSVVRALEGNAAPHGGRLVAGEHTTDLRVGPATRLAVVDGLLSGLHEPGTSHYSLLEAFAPRALLDAAYQHAALAGYLGHELGDASLIL